MQDTLKILVPIVVAHAAVLIVIIVVIRKLLLNDTLRAVNRVKQVEAEIRKKEEGIRREIEEQERDFARKKGEAEAQIEQQKEEARKDAGRQKDELLAEARKESDRIMARAKQGEQVLRDQIVQDMKEKAVDFGADIFKLVFSEKITEVLDRQFIDELLDALEEVDAESITVDASAAEFTASRPLAADQKARLEKLLAEKFRVQVKVQEKVQESLLAGLVFKLGSLEIDGSLLNRFREAAAEVKKADSR
jgi:F-type H+-transporting ATPase subunit b